MQPAMNDAPTTPANGETAEPPASLTAARMPSRHGDDAHDDGETSLALVELELALDAEPVSHGGFAETVDVACGTVGADFLFTLPAAGLAPGYQKVAVIRMPVGAGGSAFAFALLSDDGRTISVRAAEGDMSGLARFADAFVDVIGRL